MPEPSTALPENKDIIMASVGDESEVLRAGSALPLSAKPSPSLPPTHEPLFAPRTSGRLRRPRASPPPPEPHAARSQIRAINTNASGSSVGVGTAADTNTALQPTKGRPRLSSWIYAEKHPPLPPSFHHVGHLADPVPSPKNLYHPVMFPDMHDINNQPWMKVRGARPNGLLPCPAGGTWTTDVNDLLILHPTREGDPPGWSLFTCRVCGKTYDGKNSRSVARRHLQDKHGVPLAVQSRRSRWDIERDKQRKDRRAATAEAEGASGQFVSLKGRRMSRVRQLFEIEKRYAVFLELFGPNGIVSPFGFVLIAPKFRFLKGQTSPAKKVEYLDGSAGNVIIPEEILAAVAGIREVYYTTDQRTGKTCAMPHVVKPEVMQMAPSVMGMPSRHADTPPLPIGARGEGPSGSGPSGTGSPMPGAGAGGAPVAGPDMRRASLDGPQDLHYHHHHPRIDLSVTPPPSQASDVPVQVAPQVTGSASAGMSASVVTPPNLHATPLPSASPAIQGQHPWKPTLTADPTVADREPICYQSTTSALDDVDVTMEGDAIEVDEALKEWTTTDSLGTQTRSRELSGRAEEPERGSGGQSGGEFEGEDEEMRDGKEEKARVLMQVGA